jgi:hypothetical protein
MAYLTAQQVLPVVIKSLSVVADLPNGNDNILNSPFTGMNPQQQDRFLTALKDNLNELPYITDQGTTSSDAYYDVDLTDETINLWPTVGDCVNWIVDNQAVIYKQIRS